MLMMLVITVLLAVIMIAVLLVIAPSLNRRIASIDRRESIDGCESDHSMQFWHLEEEARKRDEEFRHALMEEQQREAEEKFDPYEGYTHGYRY